MLAQLWHAIKSGLSLRHKLLLLAIVPLLLLTVTVIYFLASWSTKYTYEQLFTKVNTDLNVARNQFERIQVEKQNTLVALAGGARFLTLLKRDDATGLTAMLDQIRVANGYDYLNLLNPDGTRRLGEQGWAAWQMPESSLTRKLLVNEVGTQRIDIASGIEIYPREYWSQQQTVAPDDVVFPLVDTLRATPTTQKKEDRAMVIRALQRVVDVEGNFVAILEGGTFLNNNFDVVDKIRDLVYGQGSLFKNSIGTVTVFLDDVRITTNVPSADNSRALGTRVSREVRNSVLRDGQVWIDRAFVVNDWYISAYEPIVDVEGDKVGMLYAGYLEKPYRNELNKGIALISAMLTIGSLLALAAAVYGARSIFKPVETIARVIRATALGERRRIGRLDSGDEIGELAGQFDYMLDTLEQNQARIEHDAMQLEEKVRSRTTELQQQNLRLQESILLVNETRQRLAMVEKLAAVGQLTAGVAHEINNPTAVILGNMDILLEEIGDVRSEVQVEIDLIIEQVYRIRSITDRLLQYSRPGPITAKMESFDGLVDEAGLAEEILSAVSPSDSLATLEINEAISDTVHLVQHELDAKAIELELDLMATGLIGVDRQEFQQVLVNLLSNAIDAVATGGRVAISSGSDSSEVWLIVKDNGKGIAAADLQRLFDPFFTRGKEQGTGLGLSVSYGIVRRYDGQIDVESNLNEGAHFTIRFPNKGHPRGVIEISASQTKEPELKRMITAD